MRFSVFVGTSIDGFIARADGGLDWLPDNPEPHGYEEFLATVDGIVIGRKTFETVLSFNYWPYGKRHVVVLTSNPSRFSTPDQTNCHFMKCEPLNVAAFLKSKALHRIYVDGGMTVQAFLEAGLIDDLTITRVPVLIGSGIPLFGFVSRDIHLEHVHTKTYPSGLVSSEYVVKRDPGDSYRQPV